VSDAFNSSPAPVGQLLSTSTAARSRIVIPTFQRGYMWKKKHVEAFWEDVDRQCEQNKQMGSDPHFFGPIVTQANPQEGSINLLDGQQRLATATILFSVMRDVAREIGDSTGTQAASDFAANLQSQYIHNEDDGYSLEMGETDLVYFRETVQSDPPHNAKAKQVTHRNIKAARDVLHEKVVTAVGGKIEPQMDSIKAIKLLKDLKQTLVNDFITARIPVTSMESAFKIFTTLNDRGLRLSPPDLLLSYLMEKAPEGDRREIRIVWTQMVQKMGTHDIHDFLRAMWISKYGDLKKDDLFTALKKHIEKNQISSLDFAKLCGNECDEYTELVTADEKELPREALPFVQGLMRELNFKPAVPLVLSSYAVLQPSDFANVAKFTLVFITRYSIFAGKDSAGMENLLFDLARTVRNTVKDENDKAQSKLAVDLVKSKLSANSPDDKAIIDAIKRETTLLDASDAKYVLKRSANYIQDPEKQITVGETNVEHIYPQNPDESEWGGKANQEKLEPLTSHLGNLTIFGRRANKKVENFEYSIKRSKYAASQVRMTKEIAEEYSTWDETTILKRAHHLAKLVVQVWNFKNPSRV